MLDGGRWVLALSLTVGVGSGCNVFNDDLEAKLADAGAELVALGESCGGDDAPLQAGMFMSSTSGMESVTSELGGCGINGTWDGPDGFFRIETMEPGERWHFMAMPHENQDLAVFLLQAQPGEFCDYRDCEEGHDQCGPGGTEHMTQVLARAGSYYVGVDSKGAGGRMMLMAMKPPCGNGVKQHGESCDGDDPGYPSGAICEPTTCRLMLPSGDSQEWEPNDDNLEANLIDLSSGPSRITGQAGTACDVDRYGFEIVDTGAQLDVMLTGPNGQCTGESKPEPTVITIWKDDLDVARATDSCPTLSESLAPGEYSVTVQAQGQPDQYAYMVEIELTTM